MNSLALHSTLGEVEVIQTKRKGLPLVFIHGNSLSHVSFQYQLKCPLFKKFRLVFFDLPGHGNAVRSGFPERDYRPRRIIQWLVELIQRMDADDGILIGHSLGGHLAIQTLEFLPNIKGTLVFGTPPFTNPPQTEKAFLPNPAIGLLFQPNLSENDKTFFAANLVKKATQPPSFLINAINQADPMIRSVIGKSLMNGEISDEVQMIKEFTKPFAFIHGEDDPLINLSYLEDIKLPNIWDNKVHCIKDAGHCPQIEQPEKFNQLLAQFLKHCKC